MNAPTSGTYGEGADLERLKASLPAGAVGGKPAPAPTGPPMSAEPPMPMSPNPVGRPPGAAPPPGVPAGLVMPTSRPDQPVSTPLSAAPAIGPGAADPRQARVAILDALANDPAVSDETREWAGEVLRLLIQS